MYLTLEQVKANPLFRQVNAADLELKTVSKAISMTQSAASHKISVDRFALTFYTLNHAYSEIRNRKLDKEPLTDLETRICQKYEDTIAIQARFLFAYLTLACIREARHAEDPGTSDEDPADVKHFFDNLSSCSSHEAVDRFIHRDINCTVGEFLKVLSVQFKQNNYANGFGGEAWADIADCCFNFVNGTLTAEVFVDLGYHLEHNNGSVFNKDFIFSSEKPDLQKILDCQAAGQAPNLSCHPTREGQQFILESALDESVCALVRGQYDPVDWSKVYRKGNPSNGQYDGFLTNPVKTLEDNYLVTGNKKYKPASDKTPIHYKDNHEKHQHTGEIKPFANHGLNTYQQIR
ncbi:hypothetical protein R21Y_102 [Vibrio phage vB_VhaS_R21Y]|nr:hypothetical protein R21Y_102 [Vibrio phage vB_VhaS_R21Y]